MKRPLTGDRIFFILVVVLAAAGIAIFSSATLGLLAREGSSISKDILLQAGLGLGLGFVALFAARSVPLPVWKRMAPYVYAASLAFTALVFVPGVGLHLNGATRWINLGFTTVQPAEFLKIGVVLLLAWWLSAHARKLKDIRYGLLPVGAMLAVPAVLLLLQPNTSTTMLIFVTGAVMYFAAGAPLRDFAIGIGLALLVLVILFQFRGYVHDRLETYLHPTANSLSTGYQIQQSLIAVGSGQFFGRGFGQSVEKFNYLPEPDGDSIYAVFAEETGFVGAVLLLALLFGLAARGIVIAGDSKDLFGGLMAFGLSFLILLQAFINICAMVGLIPLTGMPLPFVSHGGTALLVTLFMCGLILNVAAHRRG